MLRALLWKDMQANRVPLLGGLLFLFNPIIAGILLNCISAWRYGYGAEWGDMFIKTGTLSLVLSFITFAMVPGNVIAGERADRSAEFLAYLPPSRRIILLSKAIWVVAAIGLAWAVCLACVWWIAPWFGKVPEDPVAWADQIVKRAAVMTPCMAGAAWLASCILSSPVFATAIGLAAPWLILSVLGGVELGFGWEGITAGSFGPANILTGGLSGWVGSVLYLQRVEP